MQIVEPVIIRPLSAEWAGIRAEIEELIASAPQQTAEKLLKGADKTKRDRAFAKAQELLRGFVERLRTFRVLDPACGSGNFLYLSLLALKDLEHLANLEAEALGCSREFPAVGPECVLGIELNPYAAELARVSVWIGEIQWMRRNGFEAAKNPILRSLGNIENRDAVLVTNEHGIPVLDAAGKAQRASWPQADVVVGNPPFLGDKKMLSSLGREYTDALRSAFKGKLAGRSDLVCYWFVSALMAIKQGRLIRAGFVATNSIKQTSNRGVLEAIFAHTEIFQAWSDEPWVVDGASVRVSLVCFGSTASEIAPQLDGQQVAKIGADLKAISDGNAQASVSTIKANAGFAFQGVKRVGQFEVPRKQALEWLSLPINPHGRSNADVLRPWASGFDVVRRPQDYWIVDFGWDTPASEAALYEAPFQYLEREVKPTRKGKREARANEMWWIFYWPRPELRRKLRGVSRFAARPSVSKHHIFRWLDPAVLPDGALVVIAKDDDVTFGIIQSRLHEVWGLSRGSTLEDRPAYTPSTTFETFPFPEGLSPDISAANFADEPRAKAIAVAAARLNELRENWLNPPDLIERVPEVVPGYPDRILPKDEAAAQVLKKRTLTNLYNARPAWLDHAHRALDEAVADAYGWGDDYRAGTLTDDEILARLFRLNQERTGR
ncbi:MAG: hypothetical protein C0517_10730 [Erythrobacter sp.]|nr:hypothetical protein [Erythrobacter sp.]